MIERIVKWNVKFYSSETSTTIQSCWKEKKMRQIDADTLREKIEAYRKDAEKVLGMVGGCVINSIEYIISQIPTIESEPVRHGRFVFEKGDGKTRVDGWICTSCHFGFHTNVPYFRDFKFCPNCGAKMEEEK